MQLSAGTRTTLIGAAVAVLIGSALVWDVTREGDAAVQRLLYSQHRVALAMAHSFASRLATLVATDEDHREAERERLLLRMLPEGRFIERGDHAILLVKVPEHAGLRTTDGGIIASPAIERALTMGESGVMLSRDEASGIGLPHRSAVAAIARIDDTTGLPPIAIVMASSSREERDRFRNYEYRLAAGLTLTALLVVAFIRLALRQQREKVSRERDEQLARADRMAAIAALSLGIGHELATPLGVILGRVEELGRNTSDPVAAKALTSIEEQVAGIRRVLQGFLSLARGDAPAMESVKAARLVDGATGLVGHRFASAGVGFTTHVEGSPSLRCDSALFAQVLVNLLVNACAHSRAGQGVQLDVARQGGSLTFTVTDSGAGIAPEVIDRAADPFFTTRRAEGGSGLGLTIAREIVQHHGGTLHIAARPGEAGTVVTVTVPAESDDG